MEKTWNSNYDKQLCKTERFEKPVIIRIVCTQEIEQEIMNEFGNVEEKLRSFDRELYIYLRNIYI